MLSDRKNARAFFQILWPSDPFGLCCPARPASAPACAPRNSSPCPFFLAYLCLLKAGNGLRPVFRQVTRVRRRWQGEGLPKLENHTAYLELQFGLRRSRAPAFLLGAVSPRFARAAALRPAAFSAQLRSVAVFSRRCAGQWVERPLWGMARPSRMRRCFSRCSPSPCYLHLRLLPRILLSLASLIPSVLPLLPHPVVLPRLCSAGWVGLVAVFSLLSCAFCRYCALAALTRAST